MRRPGSSVRQEHPRVCGENESVSANINTVAGTSPRTRGKPHCTPPTVTVPRNIPAHAGKTLWSHWCLMGFAEHPRARGENPKAAPEGSSLPGTSPRTRGKLGDAGLGFQIPGNIPAHAGKTTTGVQWGHWADGTSPRTRGKPTQVRYPWRSVRNIPAHAGKTHAGDVVRCRVAEHPRARGENIDAALVESAIQGTSPRTRGKPFWRRDYWPADRNIPAHAGKT